MPFGRRRLSSQSQHESKAARADLTGVVIKLGLPLARVHCGPSFICITSALTNWGRLYYAVDIASIGTVEKISVRSFQLRHHKGPLHTIPFGEIRFLTNFSRDWVIMKLPLRVTYDTDVEKVRKLIKKLGVELLDDPVIGKDFIQPLKSQGIIEMQDSAMIIRVKFMTTPNEQWVIRKRVFEEIRELFEREGVRFAHREVTVRLADGKVDDLTPNQKEAVTAAAQSAIDDDLMDEASGAGDDR